MNETKNMKTNGEKNADRKLIVNPMFFLVVFIYVVSR
jgi:hypothetical protein